MGAITNTNGRYMGQLADELNRYCYTGESCEWCDTDVILDRDTGETECGCDEYVIHDRSILKVNTPDKKNSLSGDKCPRCTSNNSVLLPNLLSKCKDCGNNWL